MTWTVGCTTCGTTRWGAGSARPALHCSVSVMHPHRKSALEEQGRDDLVVCQASHTCAHTYTHKCTRAHGAASLIDARYRVAACRCGPAPAPPISSVASPMAALPHARQTWMRGTCCGWTLWTPAPPPLGGAQSLSCTTPVSPWAGPQVCARSASRRCSGNGRHARPRRHMSCEWKACRANGRHARPRRRMSCEWKACRAN